MTESSTSEQSAKNPPRVEGADLVLSYLLARRPDLASIDEDLDLIDNRVIDSLGFVNFLYVLEEATGRSISMDEVSAEDFRTLRRIRLRFFG
jgi:acyl carrier protein